MKLCEYSKMFNEFYIVAIRFKIVKKLNHFNITLTTSSEILSNTI